MFMLFQVFIDAINQMAAKVEKCFYHVKLQLTPFFGYSIYLRTICVLHAFLQLQILRKCTKIRGTVILRYL